MERMDFRRKKVEVPERPKLAGQDLKSGSVLKIVQACEEYLDFLGSDEYHEDNLDDYENYIFEATMIALYGEDVFDYINYQMGRER